MSMKMDMDTDMEMDTDTEIVLEMETNTILTLRHSLTRTSTWTWTRPWARTWTEEGFMKRTLTLQNFFPIYIDRFFLHLSCPSEAIPRYCAIPDGNPPKN